MIFNSLEFIVFFAVVFALYFIIPYKYRWTMLLAVSYYFYMYWKMDLVYLILCTTIISYISGIIIENSDKQSVKRFFLVLTLITSLGVLIFFKYFNFLSETVIGIFNIFGAGLNDFSLNLILPVGISFYTFQTLSYVIDIYRGSIKAERHFGYYALFVSFFPQLVAGPIERPQNLLPQLKKRNPFTAPNAIIGLKMMAVGFFKKLVVADQIAPYVNAVYNNANSVDTNLVNGFTIALSTVLFAVQIYCDFSGYTDIAIGCARTMGIKLTQNFNNPYTAVNIKDFWRRWHMTLTSWFTDYLYIPLGGSRCSRPRYYLNLFIVFLVSGIWHGAALTFILWGTIHGIYQIIGNLTAKPRSKFWAKLHVNEKNYFFMWVRRIITFTLVSFAWIAFRANSVSDLIVLVQELFTGWSGVNISASIESMGLSVISLCTALLAIIMINQLDKQVALKIGDLNEEKGVTLQRAMAYVYLCWAVAAGWLILLSSNAESAFIYFQF